MHITHHTGLVPFCEITYLPDQRPIWLVLAPLVFLMLWSGGYVVAKIGLQYAPPLMLLGLRYGFVLLIMAGLFVVLRPPLPATLWDWGHLAVVGVLMQTVYFGMSYMAFTNGVSAGTAALLLSLQPILVALIVPRLSSETTGWRHWVGLLIALGGTAMVIISRMDIDPPSLLGFVYIFLALAGITAATLWEKRFGLSHHPVTANLIGYAAGLICLLPFLVVENGAPVDWTVTFVAALAYLVIGNSVIAVGLLLAMIRVGEVSRVSTLLFLVPPLAALIAWFALGEHMPLAAWIGLMVAGAGVFLATRKSRA